MRAMHQNLILSLWGNFTAVIQILLCTIWDCISPSSCLARCFRKPFPVLVTFLGLSSASEAPSYTSTCIFTPEPSQAASPAPARRRPLPVGLLGSTRSRAPALDAYLNQLDLEGKRDFGLHQKPSVPLFSSWNVPSIFSSEMRAVQRLHGCRQGLPWVRGGNLSSRLLGFWGWWNWCSD